MDGSGTFRLTSTVLVSAGWEDQMCRERKPWLKVLVFVRAGTLLSRCPSRERGWWDGGGCESHPGMLAASPTQDGLASAADGAGMDHTETLCVPSPASQGQLRLGLRLPVDKRISLLMQNLAAELLSTGARSAPGSVCFAGAALQLRYPVRREREPKGFPEDKQF